MSRYSDLVLADHPVGYWRLNETSGTTAADSSGRGNAGTYTGGFTLNQAGALLDDSDVAVLLNGTTGYLAHPSLALAPDGTWECWFSGAVTGTPVLAGKSGDQTVFFQIPSATSIRIGYATSLTKDWTVPAITANSWNHLVITVKNGSARVFLNGEESSSGAQSITGTLTLDQFGRYENGGFGYWWNGKVDELALYNYALPGDRIIAHYTEGRIKGYEDEVLALAPKLHLPLAAATVPAGATISGAVPVDSTPIADTPASTLFDGVNDYASIPIDLSAYSAITVSWWLWWDAFGSNDKMAFEFGPAMSPRGFDVDMNEPSGYTQLNLSDGSVGYYERYVRPSAAAWHHYVAAFDYSGSPVGDQSKFWIDGILQTPAASNAADVTGTHGNTTLYVMSRSGTGLFGAGRMRHLAIHSGVLTDAQVRRLYAARLIPPLKSRLFA